MTLKSVYQPTDAQTILPVVLRAGEHRGGGWVAMHTPAGLLGNLAPETA